jgi:hypothetical protein
VGQRLSEAELLTIHNTSHCYVSAARGEAWGLGAFEAALLGNPVIMPGFGGQTDFLDTYAGWTKVPHFLTPAIGQDFQAALPFEVAGLRFKPMTAGVPMGLQADQHWAEPDLGFLQDAMRSVAAASYLQQRPYQRAELERRFGYQTVGPQLVAALYEATKIRRRLELDDEETPPPASYGHAEAWNNDLKEIP